ncbi:MAG TPA: hypothetical protein PLP73_03070 [Candidatus Absconditabacterales bacterium]|nr:hypothetical protein [Candidatus Absconditabacterales bacterium]
MTTTYTARVKPDTTYTARVKPVKYIQLLQDAFDNVEDALLGNIYVYSNTGTPIGTLWTARVKPVKYIELLQDAFDSVRDLDGNDIYVYSNTGTPIEGTLWTARTPI